MSFGPTHQTRTTPIWSFGQSEPLHVLTDRASGRTPRNVFATLFRLYATPSEEGWVVQETRKMVKNELRI